MKILIENGCYQLHNMGDIAMLQIAEEKLRTLWPEAEISIVTDKPALLARHCPKAKPVPARGRDLWFQSRYLFGRMAKIIPRRIFDKLSNQEDRLRARRPRLLQPVVEWKLRRRGVDVADMKTFIRELLEADLVAVSGGGNINDFFEGNTLSLLDILAMAVHNGNTTIMLGQGLGPIRSSESKLTFKAKEVLPFIDHIFVREKLKGPGLLSSLGVSGEKVTVTGDDAVEQAYRERSSSLGKGIGINLRIARYSRYSAVDELILKTVREVLHKASRKLGAPLIPVPISFYEGESDVVTIGNLLEGYPGSCDRGETLDTPVKVIKQVGLCRVVVTGSYHGAVFALAQGIPAVGLVKSEYYYDKFRGLADQFGGNCEIVDLNDPDISNTLEEKIDAVWRRAEALRPVLLEAARRQIALQNEAYCRIYEVARSKGISPGIRGCLEWKTM